MQLYTKLHKKNRIFYSSVLWCAYPPKMRPLLMQLPPPDALWHCLLWFGMLFAFWDMRTSTYCCYPYPYKMPPSADADASWCKEFFGWDAFCFWDIRSRTYFCYPYPHKMPSVAKTSLALPALVLVWVLLWHLRFRDIGTSMCYCVLLKDNIECSAKVMAWRIVCQDS